MPDLYLRAALASVAATPCHCAKCATVDPELSALGRMFFAVDVKLAELEGPASVPLSFACPNARPTAETDQLAARMHAQPPLTPEQYDAELALVKAYLATLPKGSKAAVR
jgi:hypothetical protein